MLTWLKLHPKANEDHLGQIPAFLSPADPRNAAAQINERYAHGGGWSPLHGFARSPTPSDEGHSTFVYPGDRPLLPLYSTTLRDETIIVYHNAWVSIEQPDGSYEIARLD